MTTLTNLQASDEIKALFWERFSALYGVTVPVRWADKEESGEPTANLWVHLTVLLAHDSQSAFCGDGPPRKYTAKGTVLVRCYARKSQADASDALQSLSGDVQDIFRGASTPGGVWFRNSSVKTVGLESLYYRDNVVADFSFDSHR